MRRVLAICILGAPALLAQSTVSGSRTVLGSWDASGASATKPAKAAATLPGSCFSGEFFFNTAASSGQNIYLCNPNNIWSPVGGAAAPHNLLSASDSDTTPASVTRGAFITGQGSPATWSSLALGATSRFLRSNGTDLIYSSGPAAGAGACAAGQVVTAGNSDAAPTCSAPAYSWLTGVPTFYYQTLQSNASNQTQRANLNLSNQFALTDSAVSNSTTVTLAANLRARAIGATFSGGGNTITVGLVNYFTVPFACTISAWSMTLDTGTATIDVWKVATGTAIPTASNTITASATPAISSATALHSSTLTGWTTSVSANDIIAFQIKAVTFATVASLVLECDQ